MPFERIDKGQHVGMTADYLAIMAQKIGKPILLVPTTTWVQTLKFAQTRKCDIFSLAMETENRKKYMDFILCRALASEPLLVIFLLH